LENPEPIVTLGTCVQAAKHIYVIGQVSGSLLSMATKFQPCGHMHAGLGVDFGFTGIKSKIIAKSIQSSLYFGTHSGGSFALLGRLGLDTSVASNLQIGGTMKLWKPDPVSPGQNHIGTSPLSPETSKSIEATVSTPIIGFNYDLLQDKISTYIDLKLSASEPKQSTISLNVRLGMYVDTNSLWRTPTFGIHLNASEK
jgi:hypothetical protein